MSFSAMNFLHHRIGNEALNACIKISSEGAGELSSDMNKEVLDVYAKRRHCRIRLIQLKI